MIFQEKTYKEKYMFNQSQKYGIVLSYMEIFYRDDDHHVSRSYSQVGTTPYIATPDSRVRDTVVVAIANDGQKLKKILIIEHKRRTYSKRKNKVTGETITTVKDKGKQGLHVEDYRQWIKNYFLTDSNVSPGDTLVVDNLTAHNDAVALSYLREKGFLKIQKIIYYLFFYKYYNKLFYYYSLN